MKINFDGTFRDVSKLLRAYQDSANPIQQKPKTLASISPDFLEQLEKTKDASQLTNSGFDIGDLKEPAFARANVTESKLFPPMPKPIDIVVEEPQNPIEHDVSVKTPALLEVHRVDSVDPTPLIPNNLQVESQPPVQNSEIAKLVKDIGLQEGIDPSLGMAVIKNESSFDPKAVSKDGFGSKGLFQLLDSTGMYLHEKKGLQAAYDPFNPEQNVQLGVSYLRYLHDVFSSSTELGGNYRTEAAANSASVEKFAVAAFNAGEGRVADAQRRARSAGEDPSSYENVEPYLPSITQNYVKRVVQDRNKFVE